MPDDRTAEPRGPTVVIDAMRRAVTSAGLNYHDPVSPDSDNPGRVTWRYMLDFWRARHIEVSTSGTDHAKMTDAERVSLWRWLMTGEPTGKRASVFVSALDVQRHVAGPWRDDAARVVSFCAYPVKFVEEFFRESCERAGRAPGGARDYFAPDTNLPHPHGGVSYLQWRPRSDVPRVLRVCANSLGMLAVETWDRTQQNGSYAAATLNEATTCRLWAWLHGDVNDPPRDTV